MVPQEPHDDDLSIEFVDHPDESHAVVGTLDALSREEVAPGAEAGESSPDVAKLTDQLLRQRADFENFRRRMAREVGDAGEKARADLLREFIPVLDTLDRALALLDQEAPAEWCRGMKLVHQTFVQVLQRAGVAPLEALGQPFDPQVHDAISVAFDPTQPDNAVVEVVESGYTMNGKLLRPARVRVNRLAEG